MTTVATPPSTDGRRTPTRDVPTVAPRQVVGRNRGRIAAGFLLLAASALLAVAVYGTVGDRKPVLGVARTVDPGQVIEAADLTVVRVAADPGVETVPESQRSSIIGQRAAIRLLPGSLLSAGAVTEGSIVRSGSSVVGALVKPGQYPIGIRTGDAVQVVVTGGSGSTSDDPIDATIVSISSTSGPNGTAISLAVPAANASRLAVAGAEGRLVLVVPPA